MTGTFTARTALLLLAVVIAVGIGLLWWLNHRPELARTSPVQPKPPAQAERSSPPPATVDKLTPKSITEATETIKDLGSQFGAAKPATPEPGPQFDVARIEPNGDSVIAGRATPNATVELMRNGEVHDRTVADSTGAFVFVPKPLPRGKFDLKLRATEPGGRQMVSNKSISVELGSPAQDKAVAALAPSAPAVVAPPKLASPPEAPSAAQPKPTPQVEANVRIDLAEAQDGGKLYVSGRSAPGASIRLYLNDAFIATGKAAADGQVSFFIGGGVKPGEYRIRLDQLGTSDKVLARAEVPFTAPATLASSAPATPPAPPSSSAPQTSVAATQPQQAAPAPQASAPASPTVTADMNTPQAAAPRARIDAGAPAAKSPALASQQAPRPQQPATSEPVAKSQPGPQILPVAPHEIASAATNLASSTQSPPQSAAPAKDSRENLEPAAPKKTVAATDRSDTVVVPNIDTRIVIRGDNLWRISRTTYGHGIRYTVIYKANRDQIRDPDLIYPGQIFVLPKAQP